MSLARGGRPRRHRKKKVRQVQRVTQICEGKSAVDKEGAGKGRGRG